LKRQTLTATSHEAAREILAKLKNG
jgi:hypothetical protein